MDGSPRACQARRRYPSAYHDDFLTPGSSPRCAISRKQIRHKPNLRMYPRGRPQTLHRWYSRTLNFCGRRALTFRHSFATGTSLLMSASPWVMRARSKHLLLHGSGTGVAAHTVRCLHSLSMARQAPRPPEPRNRTQATAYFSASARSRLARSIICCAMCAGTSS